ncbi:MAG: hypothetical protein ACRER3_17830 [Pseudomonas fluorescens]
MTVPAFGVDGDLVRLRDEIAMHALNSMVIAGGWGYTDGDGKRHNYKSMVEYSNAAYRFADEMLKARERR